MKTQYNSKTNMAWVYISTSIYRFLGLQKGDEVEFVADDKTKKVEFRKKLET